MQKATIKRHAFRTLLVIHFVGLALSLGARLADYVIEQQTSHGTLQALAFGRDLTGGVARTLIVPAFLSLFLSGVALTLLRYGRHAPLWVWIKVALNLITVVGISPFVAPAVAGARQWAHWSAVVALRLAALALVVPARYCNQRAAHDHPQPDRRIAALRASERLGLRQARHALHILTLQALLAERD